MPRGIDVNCMLGDSSLNIFLCAVLYGVISQGWQGVVVKIDLSLKINWSIAVWEQQSFLFDCLLVGFYCLNNVVVNCNVGVGKRRTQFEERRGSRKWKRESEIPNSEQIFATVSAPTARTSVRFMASDKISLFLAREMKKSIASWERTGRALQ